MALLYQQEGEPERALALAQEAAAAFGKIGHPQYTQRAQQLVTQLQGGEAPSNLNQAQILENFNPLIEAVVNATKAGTVKHNAGARLKLHLSNSTRMAGQAGRLQRAASPQ